MQKMKIASYSKEAEILEKVLRRGPGCGIIPFQYTKTVMENNEDGFDFEITTESDEDGLLFYWIGVEFAKRVMRYNLQYRFALCAIDRWDDESDNKESELIEAIEYCREAFELSGVEDFAKGGLKESAYNKAKAVLEKYKPISDETNQ